MQATKPNRHTRRRFLRGLGLAGVGLPFVPLLEARADNGGFPCRLVVFCTTTGMTGRYPGNWAPTTTANGLSLSPILAPMGGGQSVHGLPISDLSGQCNVFQGIDMPAFNDSPAIGAHPRGLGVALTGTPILEGNDYTHNNGVSSGWAGGISLDQHVAATLGQDTPFSSLDLGVRNDGGVADLRYVLSYKGASQPVPVESDPYAVFDRLFGDLDLDPAEADRLRVERLSVLDYVGRDLNRFSSQIAAADRHKMDAHLTAVRSIEQRLANGVPASCDPVEPTAGIDPFAKDSFPLVGHLQMDLLVAALSCGLTNVASLLWGWAPYSPTYSWIPGVTSGNHGLSHAATSDDAAQDQAELVARWQTEQFAYLVQKLADIPEGGGTLLDNTLVLWVTENGRSNTHSPDNMPYIMAGGAGLGLQTGRLLEYGGVPHNQLYVSVCQALGLPDTQFGHPQYGSGGLVGLL